MSLNYKIGFLQTRPVFGDVKENLAQAERALVNADADLIVLPELFTTGYQFQSREEAESFSESIPEGPTTEFLTELARFKNFFIVAGLAEKHENFIYNSAVVVGPDGYIGTYRKAHIFDTENRFFTQGNLPLEVFQLGEARVGVMICFDWRFPETARTLALRGADIIAHPSNLVLPHCPDSMVTRCLENRVYAVTSDRIGNEERVPGEPLTFIGKSQVVDPDGNILVRASEDQEELQIVEIDLEKARNKSINGQNDLLQGRRDDLYNLTR